MKPIEQLRLEVYNYYENLLKGMEVKLPSVPNYLDLDDFVLCSQELEDPEFSGINYVAGKVVSRESIGPENYQGIVIKSNLNGILPFEEFFERDIMPVFTIPSDRGLVINLSSLERNAGNKLLQGKSSEEIIKLNFDYFPLLLDKSKRLSAEEYREFYSRIYSENPIFY